MQKTTNFMYIWGELILLSLKPFGRFPVTLQRLWITASFCFFLFFFFPFPSRKMSGINTLIQNGTAVPCSAVVRAPFLGSLRRFSRQQGAQPERSPSASTAMPGRCKSTAEQGHHQVSDKLVYAFKTHKKIQSLVVLMKCWGTCMLFAMCLLESKT